MKDIKEIKRKLSSCEHNTISIQKHNSECYLGIFIILVDKATLSLRHANKHSLAYPFVETRFRDNTILEYLVSDKRRRKRYINKIDIKIHIIWKGSKCQDGYMNPVECFFFPFFFFSVQNISFYNVFASRIPL